MSAGPLRLACFVTPHGFGHAARACAVLAALGKRRPLAVELFTAVPRWFFADSLSVPFSYHEVRTDVGLAQHDALDEDLEATVRALDAFLPFDPALQLVKSEEPAEPQREVSLDAFASLLFAELARRSAAMRDRETIQRL